MKRNDKYLCAEERTRSRHSSCPPHSRVSTCSLIVAASRPHHNVLTSSLSEDHGSPSVLQCHIEDMNLVTGGERTADISKIPLHVEQLGRCSKNLQIFSVRRTGLSLPRPMAFLSGPRLLDWASSPPHLQFNKFVLTGYRPVASGAECMRSLFYLHNELGNIYTHGIPLLGFFFLLPLQIPWRLLSVPWLGVVHYLACVSPQLGSVLYHLFMNHHGGAPVYHKLLKLDMCGICLVNTLGALPIIYCTLLCYPSMRSLSLLVYSALSSYVIFCAVSAHSNISRLCSFMWQAAFRFFFFYLRWADLGSGHPSALRCYLLMDSLALLGGIINISRLPERLRPGKFDYWCNSHQIMHVLVVISILYLHWGVTSDLTWISSYTCPPE